MGKKILGYIVSISFFFMLLSIEFESFEWLKIILIIFLVCLILFKIIIDIKHHK